MGALMNILDNAIQASDKIDSIEVTISVMMDTLKIDIKDYGKGILQEDLERIKKPFYTTKKNGTGLGLSIAKSILEAHQGKLEIESVCDKYTTVSLYLPIMIT
jgi:signal transduction histidine kinase